MATNQLRQRRQILSVNDISKGAQCWNNTNLCAYSSARISYSCRADPSGFRYTYLVWPLAAEVNLRVEGGAAW